MDNNITEIITLLASIISLIAAYLAYKEAKIARRNTDSIIKKISINNSNNTNQSSFGNDSSNYSTGRDINIGKR